MAIRTPTLSPAASAISFRTAAMSPFAAIVLATRAMVRAADLAERICDHNLGYHMRSARRRRDIARHLIGDYPAHTYPIMLGEARAIGIQAKAMPADIEAALTTVLLFHRRHCLLIRNEFSPLRHHDTRPHAVIATSRTTVTAITLGDWERADLEGAWRERTGRHGWFELNEDGAMQRIAEE